MVVHSTFLATKARQKIADAYLFAAAKPNLVPSPISSEILWHVSYKGISRWFEEHNGKRYIVAWIRKIFKELRPTMQLWLYDRIRVFSGLMLSMRTIIVFQEESTHSLRTNSRQDHWARILLREKFIHRTLYLAWESSQFHLEALREGVPTMSLWEIPDETLLSHYKGLWSAENRRSHRASGRIAYAPRVLKQLFKGLRPSRQLMLLVKVEELDLGKLAIQMLASAALKAPEINDMKDTSEWSEDDFVCEAQIREEMIRCIKRWRQDATKKLCMPCPEPLEHRNLGTFLRDKFGSIKALLSEK